MATKKPLKINTKHRTTGAKSNSANNYAAFGKCFVGLALIITALLFGLFYYMGQAKSSQEQQEVQAFRGLAQTYLFDEYYIEGVQTAEVTDVSVDDDHNLYVDFVITKFEDHIPMSQRSGRLTFQCNETDKSLPCAQSFKLDDWKDTSTSYREKARYFYDISREYVNRAEAATSEAEREAIIKEYQEFINEHRYYDWARGLDLTIEL